MHTNFRTILLTLNRLIIGLVFVFSGFAKAADPVGFSYKIEGYLRAAHLGLFTSLQIPTLLSIVICSMEFVLGVYLILGIRRRFSSLMTGIFMVLFTSISVWQFIVHPVANCGCFGDVIVLTDWETFAKNIVLLSLTGLLLFSYKSTIPFVPLKWQWLPSFYTCVFILIIAIRSLYFLPIVDAGSYSVGTNLREKVFPKEIDENSLPLDFYITDIKGNDYTTLILNSHQPIFLVISPSLKDANLSVTEDLNTINDWCEDHGYRMFCVTSSPLADIKEWLYYNDIQFPVLLADFTLLKTMVRSNPGLMLLRDGVIRNKWSCHALPKITENLNTERSLESTKENTENLFASVLFWYFMPMLALIILTYVVEIIRNRNKKDSKSFNVKL